MKEVVIVGASLAGLSAARALRAKGFAGRLTIVGDEPELPYDRPPLSKEILGGTKSPEDLDLGSHDVSAEWMLGVQATGLDVENRVVKTTGGELPFDGLVIATGVRPRELGTIPLDGRTVFTLRTLSDATGLRAALERKPRVLIVGAGFIGVEVATSAKALGCEVTVVGFTEPLAVAGPIVSATCTSLLRKAGITLMTGRSVTSCVRPTETEPGIATLDDGEQLGFDVAVVAIGGVPNTDWLAGSGLVIADGVVCDESCAAIGADGIVAAGDVARWPNPAFDGASMRIEHWANAVEQGTAAARTLMRGSSSETAFSSLPSFWSDHCGLRLQSIGLPSFADEVEVIEGDVAEARYALAAYRDGHVVGGLSYGMPRPIAQLRVRMSKQLLQREAARP